MATARLHLAELFESHAAKIESLDSQAGLGLSLVAFLLAENKRLAAEAAKARTVLQAVVAGLEADVEVCAAKMLIVPNIVTAFLFWKTPLKY